MKLIDRLKPEYSSKLEMYNITYPTITGNIYDELEEKEFIGDIRYSTWLDLKFFTGVDSLFDLFNEIK